MKQSDLGKSLDPTTHAANKKRRQKNENENSAYNSYFLICVGIRAILVQLRLVESRQYKYKYNLF
jgi:hypothetical protein